MNTTPDTPQRLHAAQAQRATPTPPAPVSNAKVNVSPMTHRVHTSGVGMDSQAIRFTMVQKIQAQGMQDPRVAEALRAVERHRFVDSALVPQAYEDTSLPIGLGQTISKPSVVARMLALLCPAAAPQAAAAREALLPRASGTPWTAPGAAKATPRRPRGPASP